MKQMTAQTLLKAMTAATLFTLQACAPTSAPTLTDSKVAQAFESSGALSIKPYTRTIFSSNDF